MRYALALVPLLFLVGCGGGGEQRVVPDVRGQRLDRAERVLGDGDPVLVDRLWTVCTQSPDGGTRGRFVELHIAHDCSEY